MGYSNVNVHIKLNNEVTISDIQEFLEEKGCDSYIHQGDYITVTAPDVEFDNFEMFSIELSSQYNIPILSILVYDSDLAAISVFRNGDKVMEEVISEYEKVQMDREEFLKLFAPAHNIEELNNIFDEEETFYEDVVYKLGDLLGISLLIN